MERRFTCTACGKCCHGLLPLSIGEALAHAATFPLIMVWTTVRQGGRSFEATAGMGLTIKLKKRRKAAVRIAPTAYIPPAFPCPQLADDGLCSIHSGKPQRCRTMPFAASRAEADQRDLLIPRPGWQCDTSGDAPVVYRDREVVERREFDNERELLVGDAAILKPYGEWLLDSVPALAMELRKIAMKPAGGHVLVNFQSLVQRLPKVDIHDLADKQFPVMRDWAEKTAGDAALADFHKRYTDAAGEWEKVAATRS